MTREELEAAIWRTLGTTGCGCVLREQVDAILTSADAYAAATLGEFADRHSTAALMPVHLQVDCPEGNALCTSALACDRSCWPKAMFQTIVVGDVTCGSCKRTKAYRRAALAQAVAS